MHVVYAIRTCVRAFVAGVGVLLSSSRFSFLAVKACEGSANWSGPACTAATAEMNKEVGPHNLYNMMDFCPATELELEQWNAALRPNADGSLPRMDEPRHQASLRAAAAGPAVGADPELPLGSRQRWCGVDSAMNLWLGVEAVKVALHVDKPKGTEVNNLAYHKAGADDLTELYRTLAKK